MKSLIIFLGFIFLLQMGNANEQKEILLDQQIVESLGISDEMIQSLRSGDIIGNGTGLGEQNFRFALQKLPAIVSECLKSPQCPVNDQDKKLLSEISKIAKELKTKKDSLIFVSSQQFPGFFLDADDPETRIAKTAFYAGAPIFINLEMLYKDDHLAGDMPAILSILIHEIGHQTGIRSHSLLDHLGSKLRNMVASELIKTERLIHGNQKLKVHVANFQLPISSSLIYARFNHEIYDLSYKVSSQLSCGENDEFVIGYKISNAHWEKQLWIDGRSVYPYRAWLEVHCMNHSNVIWTYQQDLEIKFYFDFRQRSRSIWRTDIIVK